MRCAVILALVAVLASTPACAMFDTSTEIETRNGEQALVGLYERIRGVTVKVLVLIEWEGAVISKHGTGVIVGRRGDVYAVVTNNHVVETKSICSSPKRVRYNVEHPDAGNINAVVLSTDKNRDLACLTFEHSGALPVAEFVSSEPPLLADVYHYGFGGLWYKGAFATKGVFSSKSRVWTTLPRAWTVTCNVWYGCSGGGVFTSRGRLMGVISVIDIERQVCLPWLVGVVPYKELDGFMGETGFFGTTIAKGD
jgi:S1-C subfamily serine protease